MLTTSPPEIPGFVPGWTIAAAAAEELEPPRRRSVGACALAHRVLDNPGGGYSGPWTFERAPWTEEPMTALSSGVFDLVVIVGSSQVAKSEVGLNWLMWTIVDEPANFIMLHPTKDMMRDFVVTRIDPMIRLSPEMRRLQLPDRSADNIFSKQFRGCNLWFAWPVPEQLSARPAPRWCQDDSDRIPEDIDGQGSADELLGARQTTFEGRDVGLKLSSPSRGKGRGIEADYQSGTRKTWRWPCPHCGEYFEPATEQLDFKRDGTPGEARLSARLVCPTNGCVIEHREKRAMNARGRWAGPHQAVSADGAVTGPEIATSTASYRFHGLIGFASWGKLAQRWRKAELAWDMRQDEAPLRTFHNTGLGENYTPLVDDEEPIAVEELVERRDGSVHRLGEVPREAVCLTASIDVQGNRFEISVWAWMPGLECSLVDRFAILETGDGRTKIDPGRHPEHWGVLLERVIWRRYPVAGAAGVEVPIVNTAIDTGGQRGVSDAATKFWYTARRAGVPDECVTLIKGGNNPNAKLASKTYIEVDRQGRPKKRGAALWVLNVNRWKDILDARLKRRAPGPGFINLPLGLPDEYLDELTAEEKQGAFWVKVRPRNETTDLYVYAAAALYRRAGERADMGWVPTAYRVPIVAHAGEEIDRTVAAAPSPPAPHPHAQRGTRRRVKGWKRH